MSESLEELILSILCAKEGNKEMCLYRFDEDLLAEDGTWIAEIGNPLSCVRIGEGPSEFEGRGATLREALLKLRDVVFDHVTQELSNASDEDGGGRGSGQGSVETTG